MQARTLQEISPKVWKIKPYIHYSSIGIKCLHYDQKIFPNPKGGYINKLYIKEVITSKNEVKYYLTSKRNATENGILVVLYASRKTFTNLQKCNTFKILYADSYDGSPICSNKTIPEMEIIAIYCQESLYELESSLKNL